MKLWQGAGLVLALAACGGSRMKAVPTVPSAAPAGDAAGDMDQDGIPDAVNKCISLAEDKDGFQDADGCPDPDNDGDGIPDVLDKCPNEAEDKDGFQDDDGCPDPDNDGDGIADAVDKCPDQPETKNGFQDDDGCPDSADPIIFTPRPAPPVVRPAPPVVSAPPAKDKPKVRGKDKDRDRDGDKIPDRLDKCPDQPEVYNGVQDADGCPD